MKKASQSKKPNLAARLEHTPHPRRKRNSTMASYPNSYYKCVYLPENLWEGLAFIAYVNGISIKQAAEEMLGLGMGHYMGELVAQQNQLYAEQRGRGEPLRPVWFTMMLRHWAHLKGYDIGKFF